MIHWYYYIKNNDILLNSTGTGTIGRCCVVSNIRKNSIADSHVTILRTDDYYIYQKYINYFLSSSLIQDFINNGGVSGSTNQIELSKTTIENFLIPLSPLKEQQKIVEKVDELMAFCDEIEREISENKESSESLMEAVLGEVFKNE